MKVRYQDSNCYQTFHVINGVSEVVMSLNNEYVTVWYGVDGLETIEIPVKFLDKISL